LEKRVYYKRGYRSIVINSGDIEINSPTAIAETVKAVSFGPVNSLSFVFSDSEIANVSNVCIVFTSFYSLSCKYYAILVSYCFYWILKNFLDKSVAKCSKKGYS